MSEQGLREGKWVEKKSVYGWYRGWQVKESSCWRFDRFGKQGREKPLQFHSHLVSQQQTEPDFLFHLDMFTFPFLQAGAAADLFDFPVANAYEPTFGFPPLQPIFQKEDIPKQEEPTSPGYAPVVPQPFQLEEPQIASGTCGKLKSKRICKKDDDYKPYKRPSKAGKGQTKQKQDRNLIPNTVHHLLAFVQKQFKSGYLVEKILPAITPSPDYTVTRFYNFHRMLRAQINNYVNEDAIPTVIEPGFLSRDEYCFQEQSFYCLLSRILIRKFLKMEAILMILRSRKVRRQNILEHLSVQRYLYENLGASYRL